MKKLAFIAVFSLFTTLLLGQDSLSNPVVIKTQPFQYLYGPTPLSMSPNVDVEFGFGNSYSFQIGVGYLLPKSDVAYSSLIDSLGLASTQFSGYSFRLAYKFYTSEFDNYLRGFYFAPNIRYSKSSLSAPGFTTRQSSNLFLGVQIGYSLIAFEKIQLTLFCAGGIQQSSSTYWHDFRPYNLVYFDYFKRTKLQLIGLSIGYQI